MKNDFNLYSYKKSLGTRRDKDVIFFEFPIYRPTRTELQLCDEC